MIYNDNEIHPNQKQNRIRDNTETQGAREQWDDHK